MSAVTTSVQSGLERRFQAVVANHVKSEFPTSRERRHYFKPGSCFTNASPPMSSTFASENFYTDDRLNLARPWGRR